MKKIALVISAVWSVVVICNISEAKIIIVDQNFPSASDKNSGTKASPLMTISHAAEIAEPGDTILVHQGVYREWVKPIRSGTADKRIVFQAADPEKVIVKGSDIYKSNWQKESGENIFSTKIPKSFFKSYNPFEVSRAVKFPDFVEWNSQYTLGQFFVNGVIYTQVIDLDHLRKTPQTWLKKKGEDKLYVHFVSGIEPAKAVIEISTRPRIFAPVIRGLGYITVKGFMFEHCANQYPKNFWEDPNNAQAGAVGCGSGHHWIVEDNIIRYANTIGLDCGSECGKPLHGYACPPINKVGYHIIRNNIIEKNGCTGIAGWGHFKTIVSGNIIRENNLLGIMSWETAGIKFHGFYDGQIRDNLIYDNDAWGIWLDNVYKGSQISANLIMNNLWGGIFFEMGSGPCYVMNNIIADSISGDEVYHRGGHGIYGHDAAGVKLYHNLFYCNSGFGVTARIVGERPGGSYNPCQASDWDVRNNIFIGNKLGNIAFTLPCERAKNNRSDNNIFSNGGMNEEVGYFSLNMITTPKLKKTEADIVEFLEKRASIANAEGIDFSKWEFLPYLTFKQWVDLLGYDKNSKLLPRDNAVTLRRKLFQLQISKDSKLFDYKFTKIKEVSNDYYGNSIKSETVFAGPFQIEPKKTQLFSLWPKNLDYRRND